MLGTGLLQGLAVTAKNFAGSFHDPKRLVTIEYPEQKADIPEAYRNFPFLVTENATDPMGTLRCVACQICEKECPPQCIYIEKSKDKKPDATGKLQLYPAVFAIDTSVCMSCQICVEVCPFDAIKMDQEYEIATTDRFTALLLNREQLAKPMGFANDAWEELKSLMQPGDELWEYCSSKESWRRCMGRSGLELVRNGIVVASIIHRMN